MSGKGEVCPDCGTLIIDGQCAGCSPHRADLYDEQPEIDEDPEFVNPDESCHDFDEPIVSKEYYL